MYQTELYWDGKDPLIKKRADLVKFLSQFEPGTWFAVGVTPLGSSNNTDQSKLYHKWCDIIANDLGWDSGDEVHAHFKETFNNGQSTKGFDTKQWGDYMTKVLAFASGMNINLPTGDN